MTRDRADVLDLMSADLTPWEWSRVLDLEPREVQAYCRARELSLRCDTRETVARLRVLEALLADVWDEVTA